MKIDNISTTSKKEITTFCKNHPHINAVGFGYGKYNSFIQIIYNNEKDFRKTLKKINEQFENQIKFNNLILIDTETTPKTLPY